MAVMSSDRARHLDPPPDLPPDPPLDLPPVFRDVPAAGPEGAFAEALRRAGTDDAGTLVRVARDDVLDLAVVLAPAEPLVSARRAHLAGMVALAEAVGAHGPPEIPVRFDWPDVLHFNGARLGGGRLGWPAACPEDAVPDWLVFGATLIASKARAGDPGLTPGSTSLEEEGFAPEDGRRIVESFARNLMRAFETWSEDGFEALGARYLAHLPCGDPEARRTIAANGDCVIEGPARARAGRRLPLLPALHAPAWLDPETGAPRL